MIYRLLPLAGVLLLSACTPKVSHTSDDEARLALDLITEERLLAHVAFLADDALEGREAGEPGYDAAADYVAEQLAAMGVAPGGEDGWFQTVPMRRYKVDTESPTMTVHRNGVNTEFTYRDDFAVGGDAVREQTNVRAEVVYVGYGVHAPDFGYSDYDGIDVRRQNRCRIQRCTGHDRGRGARALRVGPQQTQRGRRPRCCRYHIPALTQGGRTPHLGRGERKLR